MWRKVSLVLRLWVVLILAFGFSGLKPGGVAGEPIDDELPSPNRNLSAPYEWYRYQGEQNSGSPSGNAYCGQTCVAMAIQFAHNNQWVAISDIVNYLGKSWTGTDDLLNALAHWNVSRTTISSGNMTEVRNAINDRGHIVLVPINRGDIPAGSDWNVPWSDPASHFNRYHTYTGGHWVVVKGISEDQNWVIVYDPYAFDGNGYYWYSNRTAKGRERYYSYPDFARAFANNGARAIEILESPGGNCPLTSIPSGYQQCADEGGRCNFSGTANVIYGANNCYTAPRSFTNGVDCNNSVFGDPLPGVHKYCYTNASGGGCNNPSPNSDQIGLYEHADYCGAYKILSVGEYPNPGAIGLANDSISSVKVGSNVKAILCKHDGFQECEEFVNNDSNLSDNPVGNDSVSSVKVVWRVVPPSPPSLTSPANGTTFSEGQGIRLCWSATGDEYYGEIWGGPGGTLTFGWQRETCKDIGAQWAGYTYGWHVKARNNAGQSGWSATWYFTVRLGTPSSLVAQAASTNRINLSWSDNSFNEEGYRIYRDGSAIGQVAANTTTYGDDGLSCGRTYSYYVKAFRGGSESDPSNTASARTQDCPPQLCPAPSGLTATASSQTSIQLNWQDTCGNEDSFKIYRNDTLVNTVGAGTTTWADTGLSCGTTYSYYVKAHNAAGDSPASNTVSARTQDCPSSCPGGDAGNSFESATLVYPPVDKAEYICPVNDEDWYRFSASTGQVIRVTLTSLPGDYDLYLHRPNGTRAGQSENGGTANEIITVTADASGEWRVRVVGYGGAFSATDSYILRIETQSSQTEQKIGLEAEQGSLTPPMTTGSDAQASNCGYVSSPQGNQGSVEVHFSVSQAGNYYFWARGMGLSDYNENSFYASVDGGSRYFYEIPAPGGQWHWSRLFTESGVATPLWLTAGSHTIRFDGREQGARLDKVLIVNSVNYQPGAQDVASCGAPTATPTRSRTPSPTVTPTRTPTPTPPASCSSNQWRGEYFNNETLSGPPVLVKCYDQVNFEWANGAPEPGVNPDHFSARFSRSVNFAAGRYKFTVFRDDGARLSLDGTWILDEWRWGREEHSVERDISAGMHNVVLEVYEIEGWASAKLSWQQVGSNTPSTGGVQPACGRSDAYQTVNFQTTASDPDGWQDIKLIYFVVNTTPSLSGGAAVAYNAEINRMVMRNESGTGWLVGGAPGSAGTLETSRARLDVAASSRSVSGNQMALIWSLQFKEPMVGPQNLYMLVLDKSGNHTGWQAVGSWGVGTNGSPPCVGAVNPSSGQSAAGAQVRIDTEFGDPDGWEDLKIGYFLVGPIPSANSDSVYLAYNQDVNMLFLRNDQNSAWLGGFTPGTNATIQNGNVILDVADCSVSHTGQGLTVRWALRFKSDFRGAYNMYAMALDNRNYVATWQKKGTWTVQ